MPPALIEGFEGGFIFTAMLISPGAYQPLDVGNELERRCRDLSKSAGRHIDFESNE